MSQKAFSALMVEFNYIVTHIRAVIHDDFRAALSECFDYFSGLWPCPSST